MAGPVASLLLRQPLTGDQLKDLEGWLNKVGHSLTIKTLREGIKYSVDFAFAYFPPLVTKEQPHNCSFALELIDPEKNEEFSFEEDEKEILQNKLGFLPKELVVAYAGCNGSLDHQLLAMLLIEIAEKFDASMIDILGNIKNRPDLPGTVVEIPSTESPGYISILVDIQFLKNWLSHPRFHMIK